MLIHSKEICHDLIKTTRKNGQLLRIYKKNDNGVLKIKVHFFTQRPDSEQVYYFTKSGNFKDKQIHISNKEHFDANLISSTQFEWERSQIEYLMVDSRVAVWNGNYECVETLQEMSHSESLLLMFLLGEINNQCRKAEFNLVSDMLNDPA